MILSTRSNALVLLVLQEQGVKQILMIVYRVHVKMLEFATMVLLLIHVNAHLDSQDYHVKQTSMIVCLHRVYMVSALMVKILLLVLAILDMQAVFANIKLMNVNRILVNMEAFVRT